jgi:hypothetical protein
MLKAARVHGRPIMVIAMTMTAIIQPTAIHRPPNTMEGGGGHKITRGAAETMSLTHSSEWKLGLDHIGRWTIDRLRRSLFGLTTFAGLQVLRPRSAECPGRM